MLEDIKQGKATRPHYQSFLTQVMPNPNISKPGITLDFITAVSAWVDKSSHNRVCGSADVCVCVCVGMCVCQKISVLGKCHHQQHYLGGQRRAQRHTEPHTSRQ